MKKKHWFSPLLDVFGILSLVCAVIALGGAIWFVDVISESLLFNTFYSCLAAAIASFMVSRLAEISRVVSLSSDPKKQRAEPALEALTVVADAEKVTEGKFPRAA